MDITTNGKTYRIEPDKDLVTWVRLHGATPQAMQAFLQTLPVVSHQSKAA